MDAVNAALAGCDAYAVAAMHEISNNPARLARMAEDGASDADLADIFGVPEAALAAQFHPILRKARAELRGRIRRALLQAGDRGESRVLGYLALAYLDAPGAAGQLASEEHLPARATIPLLSTSR